MKVFGLQNSIGKGASINHVRFEGARRGSENIMVDHVGEGGVK